MGCCTTQCGPDYSAWALRGCLTTVVLFEAGRQLQHSHVVSSWSWSIPTQFLPRRTYTYGKFLLIERVDRVVSDLLCRLRTSDALGRPSGRTWQPKTRRSGTRRGRKRHSESRVFYPRNVKWVACLKVLDQANTCIHESSMCA